MNCVERVKSICKERKIPLSKLEKDLGFANAYVSQLKKGTFPADRLALIANYLNVSVEYLLTGEAKTPAPKAEDGWKQEVIHLLEKLSPEDLARELAYLRERAADKDK